MRKLIAWVRDGWRRCVERWQRRGGFPRLVRMDRASLKAWALDLGVAPRRWETKRSLRKRCLAKFLDVRGGRSAWVR